MDTLQTQMKYHVSVYPYVAHFSLQLGREGQDAIFTQLKQCNTKIVLEFLLQEVCIRVAQESRKPDSICSSCTAV
jgi:hypothetical protein